MSSPYWIQTHRGLAFDLSRPLPSMVCIEDIAHAEATINRYTGHAAWPYSIGQHSLMVAEIVAATAPELGLAALLHDAPEVYTNDLSSPMKALLRKHADEGSDPFDHSAFDAIDAEIERVIHHKFKISLTPEAHRIIKQADLIALATEKRDLFGPPPQAGWGDATGFALPEPLPRACERWTWQAAEDRFLQAFERYGGSRS